MGCSVGVSVGVALGIAVGLAVAIVVGDGCLVGVCASSWVDTAALTMVVGLAEFLPVGPVQALKNNRLAVHIKSQTGLNRFSFIGVSLGKLVGTTGLWRTNRSK